MYSIITQKSYEAPIVVDDKLGAHPKTLGEISDLARAYFEKFGEVIEIAKIVDGQQTELGYVDSRELLLTNQLNAPRGTILSFRFPRERDETRPLIGEFEEILAGED